MYNLNINKGNMKKFLMTLLVAISAVSAFAQSSAKEDWSAPYWWIGAQGGVGMAVNSNTYKLGKAAPVGALSLGYMIIPEVGVRLNATMPLKSSGVKYANYGQKPYNLSYLTTDADALINLCNLFGGKDYYPLNVYLIMGLGYNFAEEKYDGPDMNPMPKDINDNDMNLRLGAQLEYNIAKHWSVNAEANVNSNRMFHALVGLNYKFGMKKAAKTIAAVEEPAPAPAPVPAPAPAPSVAKKAEVAPAPAPAPAKKAESMEKNVFFTIGKSAVNTVAQKSIVEEAAAWMKSHETATAVVTGYADKGTGNEKINKAISEKRAVAVADQLRAKGIAADRIRVDYKGDTVQPFAENDQNRVVVIMASEK